VIAALYVQPGGVYYDLDDVDPWGPPRDAREYAGPDPVVAHPPCQVWCRLAGLVEARWGHKRGEDGGKFKAALAAVRRWGGVLEHPAFSDAWKAFDLNRPTTGGGWVNADFVGGWTCYVEQGRYGHRAKKATWLYMCGGEPPLLDFGHEPHQRSEALVSWCGNRTFAFSDRPRLSSKEASSTPLGFRDILLDIARGCHA
jgi:hypothetical protein